MGSPVHPGQPKPAPPAAPGVTPSDARRPTGLLRSGAVSYPRIPQCLSGVVRCCPVFGFRAAFSPSSPRLLRYIAYVGAVPSTIRPTIAEYVVRRVCGSSGLPDLFLSGHHAMRGVSEVVVMSAGFRIISSPGIPLYEWSGGIVFDAAITAVRARLDGVGACEPQNQGAETACRARPDEDGAHGPQGRGSETAVRARLLRRSAHKPQSRASGDSADFHVRVEDRSRAAVGIAWSFRHGYGVRSAGPMASCVWPATANRVRRPPS